MNSPFKICLVGAGNMGGAMLTGWLESGISPENIVVLDPAPREEMVALLAGHKIIAQKSPPSGYQPDVLIIAVKPQLMEKVLPTLAKLAGPQTVSVSIAAGTPISTIKKHLGKSAVVRAMPNTPALLRRGVTVGFANEEVSEKQRQLVDQLLQAIGKVAWVSEERQIDAVTAVSGSGPAYVFHLAETMAAAAMTEGLSEELANLLARETIAGAGEMLSQIAQPASILRENVTSPNGTTAAALAVLMADPGLGALMAKAIAAARQRAEELAAGA